MRKPCEVFLSFVSRMKSGGKRARKRSAVIPCPSKATSRDGQISYVATPPTGGSQIKKVPIRTHRSRPHCMDAPRKGEQQWLPALLRCRSHSEFRELQGLQEQP